MAQTRQASTQEIQVLNAMLDSHSNWLSSSTLASATGVGIGSIAAMLRRLEDRGYLKSSRDWRSNQAGRPPKLYSFTESGKAYAKNRE